MTAQDEEEEMSSTSTPTLEGDGAYDDNPVDVVHYSEDTESFMLRRREFLFPGVPSMVLNQDFLCVEGTGGAVWRPSILFSKFVCGEEGRRSFPLAGKSVLEISSGLGLGAIVAFHLGASPVVATDMDSDNGPLTLLRRNVSENCGRASATLAEEDYDDDSEEEEEIDGGGEASPSPQQQGRTGEAATRGAIGGGERPVTVGVTHPSAPPHRGRPRPRPRRSPPRVQRLRWGDREQLEEALANFDGAGPDVVLACDVVFDDDLLPALTDTLAEACARLTTQGTRPRLCVSNQERNRTREDNFFAGLAERLGGGEWQTLHRHQDVSLQVFTTSSEV